MKPAPLSLSFLLIIQSSIAFAPLRTKSTAVVRPFISRTPIVLRHATNEVEAEAPSDVEMEFEEQAIGDIFSFDSTALRNHLLYQAKTLAEESPTGIFLTTPKAMDEFTSAASKLEAITPVMSQREKELLVGDWILVATARNLKRMDTGNNSVPKVPTEVKKLTLQMKTPKLNDAIRNSITVLQRIKAESPAQQEDQEAMLPSVAVNDINRIDHVISYTPLTLADIVPENSPLSAIRNWNVNPLDVSESKLTLVHDANVESIEPALRTKLGLKSVIVNVAGKSQYLEANGTDVLGLNIPSLGDFVNQGSFDTTYVDENVRISRGKIGFFEELRVFVRKGFDTSDIMENGYEAAMAKTEEEEKTEVETRLEKIGDAVANVVGAVEGLDKDVRGLVEKDLETVGKAVDGVRDSITEGVKDVQNVLEDDFKKVGKAVGDVRAVVIGDQSEEESDDNIVDIDAVKDDGTTEESDTSDTDLNR